MSETFETRREAILTEIGDKSVTLVAVSKKQSDQRIIGALEVGQRIFGENRVQEAQQHWAVRRVEFPDLELHLIGPLQTNKTADAVALFDIIETLDRPKLARALAREIERSGRTLEIYIQVNTGEEPQKAGVSAAGLDGLLTEARDECGLNVTGLMCIPPIGEPAGPHFALLAKLAKMHGLANLSMGMSDDYMTATLFGATHVRIGTGLFGARET
ncbi:MAG: YggS family pyridoxal phosphate-dependent enzyme [Hyphomonadaceae bacterium]